MNLKNLTGIIIIAKSLFKFQDVINVNPKRFISGKNSNKIFIINNDKIIITKQKNIIANINTILKCFSAVLLLVIFFV